MLKAFRRRRQRLQASHEQRLPRLERRVAHLEELLEGLQDSVHRESVRRDGEATRLSQRTAPGAMARALDDDARKRGLR